MQNEICIFSIPLNALGQTPSSTMETFQFQQANCTTTDDRFESITTTESSTTQFVVDKTISLGDFVIISFIFLFLVFGIVKFFIDWFIPKKLDWKQH
jgi:hypothetical protein